MPLEYILINAFKTELADLDLSGTASVNREPQSTTTSAYLNPLSLLKNNKSACCISLAP